MADTIDEGLATAIQLWKGINLSNLQRDLDQQGLEIVENQKDSLLSRKKLAEQTREFKKIPDEDKLQQFKTLLKAYQGEIDSITRRTKFAENAFLSLYKVLAEAPDPLPLFEVAVEQTSKLSELHSLQLDNERLREDLAEANRQAAQLRGSEANAAKLQQKLGKVEAKIEDMVDEQVAQKETEMKNLMDERIRNYKEREHELQRSLNQARDQLTMLQHTHDNTQAKLIDHSQKYDEEVVAKLAELDIVMLDLERANGKIVEVERKNELLRAEIETRTGGQSIDQSQDEQRYLQQEAEISKLIKDIETYKGLVSKTEARVTKRITELTKDVAGKTEELETLRAKLKGFEDYDQIKRELEIMKYVEFSTGDDDDDLPAFDAGGVLSSSPTTGRGKGSKLDTLETLLMEKNRKLQSEVTELKVAQDETQRRLADTAAALAAARATADEHVALIKRLEDDLLLLNDASAAGATTVFVGQANSPIGELASSQRGSFEAGGSGLGMTKVDDKGILPIITSQRDRFRQRNAELEEEMRKQGEVVEDLRGEVSVLRADNLKLYERLKFVHVYREEKEKNVWAGASDNDNDIAASPYRNTNKATAAASSAYTTASSSRSRPGAGEDPADKYGRIYEESMNPFAEFHRKEESRRYNALNPADKVTLSLTRLFLANRWSRNFLIVYSMLLHLLVMVTLYRMSLWEECRHDHETPNFANPIDMPGVGMLGGNGENI